MMASAAFSPPVERLVFYVNGRRVELAAADVDPNVTLLGYVRGEGLTGSKLGCGEVRGPVTVCGVLAPVCVCDTVCVCVCV